MKAEIILGYLKTVEGNNLTIYTETRTPEGEILPFPFEGFDLDEELFKHWSSRQARYTIIDGVVKDIT